MQKNGGLLMVAMLAALCLFSLRDNTQAQFGPKADQPNDAALEATARAAQTSFLGGDYEGLFKLLAPWMQDRVRMMHDLTIAELVAEADPNVDAEVKEQAAELDPGNKLAVDSLARLRALTMPEFFGLVSAVLTLSHENKGGRWYFVDLGQGLDQRSSGRGDFLAWGVKAVFQQVDGSSFEIVMRPFGGEFRVIDLIVRGEEWDRFLLSDALSISERSNAVKFGASRKITEAELLLKSARDWSRVEYSKNGQNPGKISNPEYFDGKYYEVLDEIYGISDNMAALVAKPKQGSGKWLMILFDWASGKSHITHHASKADVVKEIERLSGK